MKKNTHHIFVAVMLSMLTAMSYAQSDNISFPGDSTEVNLSDTISTVTPDPSVDGIDDTGEGGNDRIDPNNPDPPEPPEPTDPEGDSFADPIDIGSKSDSFSYSSTLYTRDYSNQYTGRSTKDIFYSFTLTVPMNVTITHDGSTLQDTYMSLLDSTGALIVSNNDYSGEGHCSNTRQAFIRRQLAAGTYYVVSEGYTTNGIIKTNITGNVDGGYSYPSIPSTYSTDPGNAVGGMGTLFSVSPLGGAVCSIPIEVPVGVGGLQPNISITYNSQSGNGMAGYGAGLSGLSCITRGPKDIYHDTTAQGLKYLADDALYLDGVRLILSSGTAGQDSAVYNPESDPFTRVIAHGTCTSTTNNTWYEVQTPDGMKYRYGNSTDSRLSYTVGNAQKIHSWYLCRAEQPTGNYMTYSYTTINSCVYPYQISYGGNSSQNTSHFNLIEFTYENRSDVIPIRFDGQQGSMGKRLKTITGKTGGTTFRTYTLTYNTTGDGTSLKYSRLVSVTEKNAQNETLPATQLGWSYLPAVNYESDVFQIDATTGLPSGVSLSFDNQAYAAGDMDGDGFADIVGIAPVTRTENGFTYQLLMACVYYSTANAAGGRSYATNANSFHDLGSTTTFLCLNSDLKGQMFIDVDGDGMNELLIPVYNHAEGVDGRIYLHVIGQNYYDEYIYFALNRNSEPLVCTGDFDCDGRSDVAVLETDDISGNYRLHIAGFNESYPQNGGIFVSRASRNLALTSDPRKLYSDDFNGDGLVDIMVVYDSSYEIYWNQGGVLSNSTFLQSEKTSGTTISDSDLCLGDFNGDGLTDVVSGVQYSSNLSLCINNGDGTFSSHLTSSLNVNNPNYFNNNHFDVVDFDGDGRSDVVLTKAYYDPFYNILFEKTHTFWLQSTGTGFTEVYHATSNRLEDSYGSRYLSADFNGDGRMELINYGYDCMAGVNSNTTPVWRNYTSGSLTVQSGKVTSVTGDYGVTTDIKYYSATSPYVYDRGGTDPYPAPRYTLPFHVVRRATLNDCTGSHDTFYSYGGLKVHLRGRGILGFSKFHTADDDTHTVTESVVSEWDTVFFVPKKTCSTTSIYTDTARTINTFNIYNEGSRRYFIDVVSTESWDFDGNKESSSKYYDPYDGYLTAETMGWNSAALSRWVNYDDYVQAGGAWHPETVTVTQKHSDDASYFSRTTKYTYNSTTGLVTSIIENYGKSKPLTTTYTYDAWGNLASEQVSGTDITTLITYHKYDSTHRFPLRTYTSPSSSVLKRTYDTWGHVLTEQDSVNTSILNTVTYTYDSFGNLTLTEIPGNGEIRYTRGWSHDPAQRWFVLEQGSHRPWVKTWYDNRGREVKTESVGLGNISVTSSVTYNTKGQAVSRSETRGDLTLTYATTYDNRGRVTQETSPGGRTVDYQYGTRSVTSTENNDRTTIRTYDEWGALKTVTDPVSTIVNMYSSNGGVKSTVVDGTVSYITSYNTKGQKSTFHDPDAGNSTFTYDAMGRVIVHKDGRNVYTETTYDALGRVTRVKADLEVINYTYGSSGTGQMRLTGESMGSWSRTYTYDSHGRVTGETMGGRSIGYQYSSDGLLTRKTYPDNVSIDYTYDAYGNLTGVSAASGALQWSLSGHSGRRTVSETRVSGQSAPFIKTCLLDTYGYIDSLKTFGYGTWQMQADKYSFNPHTGNLTSRNSSLAGVSETYTYDDADRLTRVVRGNQTYQVMTYHDNGNILSKTGLGAYEYSSSYKPHAVQAVDNTLGLIPEELQIIDYNAWGKVTEVRCSVGTDLYDYVIEYGPDRQRVKSRMYKNNTLQYEKFYWDGYEEKTVGGVTTKYYYMEGGDGLAGLYTTTTGSGGGSHAMAAVTDHLGSILGLFDCWDYVDVYMYDAWGARTCLTGDADFDRGFTGHEHLDEVGLIDMNGRMYDPLIARFLSPDPFVQTPSEPQNFNRYSYCLNNPLKYTDPSGELAWEAVVIGSIFAANLNVAYQCVNGNINTCGDVFKYAAIGAASGASGAIVGQAVAAGISVGGFLGGAAICGSSGFTSGFISGAGNAWARGSNSGDIISAGLIEGGIGGLTAGLTGGIIAGIGTRLGGRRFWDGATVVKNLIYNKNIPKVGGDGKYGCLDACVESIDKSRGGNITKNKVRSWFPNNIDPNKNALVDKEVWSIYANETNMKLFGYSKNFIDKNTFSSFFMEGIKRGDYCSLTMNTGFSIDHSTVVNQVTERIITKMNGEILTKYTVKLMNPALGGHYINYYNIQHLLNSSNNIIRLW